ncbi:entericidin A/B family lipoprotein (plasmid) [Paroceanicella profunda]|uniref:Entericidin A/B family lipoprotein n=1 Tax=Paroceanicella profunda TaxID=2579971 RepID=A0A5B8G6A6_9RHOB|nr:entericidin A/B family lipoprotein [Paroceanicella profunda]QDL94643.1 entericidin A/B family lipoprotein [Paroceanicella profunda]
MTIIAKRLAILGVFIGLAACNTVQGIGEDVQAGGSAIESSSEKVQSDITN